MRQITILSGFPIPIRLGDLTPLGARIRRLQVYWIFETEFIGAFRSSRTKDRLGLNFIRKTPFQENWQISGCDLNPENWIFGLLVKFSPERIYWGTLYSPLYFHGFGLGSFKPQGYFQGFNLFPIGTLKAFHNLAFKARVPGRPFLKGFSIQKKEVGVPEIIGPPNTFWAAFIIRGEETP